MSGATVCLMYHELERAGRPLIRSDPGYVRYVVHEQRFADQLRMIDEMGLRGVSVGGARCSPAAGNVVLTFDDGAETDFAVAAPLLHEWGYSATFYVSSDRVGRSGYLTVEQLRELRDQGFEIGCHGATHRYLTELSDDDLAAETAGAKATLEGLLSGPVEHFSCPGGRWSARVAGAVHNAGFLTMATSVRGTNAADASMLRREVVQRATTPADFGRMCRGESTSTGRLRDWALDLAKRLLGNESYERVRNAILRD